MNCSNCGSEKVEELTRNEIYKFMLCGYCGSRFTVKIEQNKKSIAEQIIRYICNGNKKE
jgi:transcription elongation factor Elf1